MNGLVFFLFFSKGNIIFNSIKEYLQDMSTTLLDERLR